jgi:hypothetical protein
MTKDEALDLAIRSLKELVPDESDYAPAIQGQRKRQEKAITAIKQALAADVREPVATLFGSLPVYETPPVKEPVAWLVYAKGSRKYFTLTFDPNKVPEIYIGGEAVPLYTTPPAAQRPWVGLTDEERMDCIFATNWSKTPLMDTAKLIEAKLKERNT